MAEPVVDVFTQCSSLKDNFNDIYCCSGIENKFMEYDAGFLFVANPTCSSFSFPYLNSKGEPILKSPLNATAQSPWVRVAFQEYCEGNEPQINKTNQTIITTGNVSQGGGGSAETCNAAIKSFQYGWGIVDSGNRCRITIIDEKGGSFDQWAKRMATNTEGSSKPIKGSYRMKVQWGWYISGGGPNDQCGRGATDPDITGPPDPSLNSAYNICSPILWFLPDMITVNWENGKFIYTLEGVDLLVRGQEQRLNKVLGQDGDDTNPFNKHMYFTDAVRLLGSYSMPPFAVRFLSLNANSEITSMRFAKRPGVAMDNECKGPYSKWPTGEKTPLDIINNWLRSGTVLAIDQTGGINSAGKKIGITANYDSTLDRKDPYNLTKFPVNGCEELVQDGLTENIPDKGTMILWASNGVPHCQGNIADLDSRLRAVYIVNGGNCQNGSSVVLTEDGWQRINYIYRHKYSGKVACVDENGDLTWSRITNWYRNKLNNRKMVKVHLHNSRQRKGSISGAIFTEDHPMLTDSGYVEVRHLKLVEHKINSGTYQSSKEVHQAVLGMMLGDGYIRHKSYSFHCAHSEKQRSYIEHKALMLGLNVMDKPTKKYPTVKITSKSSPYWRSLRKLFYPDGVKIINKNILKDFSIISLAYLFMDDGHLKLNKKLAEIATCGFTNEEVDLLIDKIHELGIKCYRRENSKYPRIYFSIEQTKVLSEKIAPYVVESMNYKILDQHRFVKKIKLNTKQEIFYDTFDLIRCEKLENTTKYVYCIDVENYHNFITHSGVVHNCSPVLAFNPVIRWHFLLGLKAGGTSIPISGYQRKYIEGLNTTGCAISGGRSVTSTGTSGSDNMAQQNNPDLAAQESNMLHTAGNLMIHAIEAELRVQGDPSDWLCSPIFGYGRCVGIIFINPSFLMDGADEADCPIFSIQKGTSVCNSFLTNKGWFIKGVEHQIKEGSYITTLKLALPAPGAELKFANLGIPTHSGGWLGAPIPIFGGTQSQTDRYALGFKAVDWATAVAGGGVGVGCQAVCYTGGGSACDSGQPCDNPGTGKCANDDFCSGFLGLLAGCNA
jgi:hypothetical protein